MKILILASLNSHAGKMAPFIAEQAEALQAAGCEVVYFGVRGKGVVGYLKQLPRLRRVIREQHIDLVHAHYGLCCLLANLQRLVPVVSTYHGSDINSPKVRRFSKVAMRLSVWNIFVSKRTQDIAFAEVPKSVQRKSSLIPCGINLPAPWQQLQTQMVGTQTLRQWVNTVLEPNKKHVLFAGALDNPVKDPELAKEIIRIINMQASQSANPGEGQKQEVQLIELKGYTRDQVNALMYTCDALLMTSKTEGSPQVIKEAMACGLPIVSTDVGDVNERLAHQKDQPDNKLSTTYSSQKYNETKLLAGCFVSENKDPKALTGLLLQTLAYEQRTEGKQKIMEDGLRNEDVAKKLINIYTLIFSRKGTNKLLLNHS